MVAVGDELRRGIEAIRDTSDDPRSRQLAESLVAMLDVTGTPAGEAGISAAWAAMRYDVLNPDGPPFAAPVADLFRAGRNSVDAAYRAALGRAMHDAERIVAEQQTAGLNREQRRHDHGDALWGRPIECYEDHPTPPVGWSSPHPSDSERPELPDWTCGYLLGHVNAPAWAGRGPSPCVRRAGHDGDHEPLYRLVELSAQCDGYAGDPGASAARCEGYNGHPGRHYLRPFQWTPPTPAPAPWPDAANLDAGGVPYWPKEGD